MKGKDEGRKEVEEEDDEEDDDDEEDGDEDDDGDEEEQPDENSTKTEEEDEEMEGEPQRSKRLGSPKSESIGADSLLLLRDEDERT
jgi:hypothetical protein